MTGAQTDRMTRDDGWRLLSIGRHLERLGFLALALARGFETGAVHDEGGFEAVVALFDSTITFHAQYQQRDDMPALFDLLVLDRDNPRSLGWVSRRRCAAARQAGRQRAGAARRTARAAARHGARAAAGATARCRRGRSCCDDLRGVSRALQASRPGAGRRPRRRATSRTRSAVATWAAWAEPMLLHVIHETRYDYAPPVETAQHMAHLAPLARRASSSC